MRTLSCLILMLAACGDTDPQTTQTTTQSTDTGKTDTGDDTTATTDGTGGPTTGPTGTTTDSSASGTGTSTSTSTGPVEPTTGEPTTTGDTTTTTTTTTDTSTTDASSTTGEPAALTISLEDVLIYANCQPIVAADPIIGQWTTVFDNSLGEADMATLIDLSFSIKEGDPPIVVPWQATPTMSGPIAAGAKLSQPVMKLKGAPFPGCSSCGKPFGLMVTYKLGGGAEVFAQVEGTLECVY